MRRRADVTTPDRVEKFRTAGRLRVVIGDLHFGPVKPPLFLDSISAESNI
jgi:hypothetical protein